ETAAPGTLAGKTGSPAAQTAGIGYNLTVKAVDANWNLVNTVTDIIGISSTDPNDIEPASAALVSGTKVFAITNITAGTWTVTAIDSNDGNKPVTTSPPTTVNAGVVTKVQFLAPGATTATGTPSGQT